MIRTCALICGLSCLLFTSPLLLAQPGSKPAHQLTKKAKKRWAMKGKKVMKAAFRALSGRLKKAIKKGGVPQALSVCKVQAMPVTQAVAKAHKVQLGRVSHKPRNPKSAASKAERQLIKGYIRAIKAGRSFGPTVQKQGKAVVVYAPIVMAFPLCVRCHGVPRKSIKPAHVKLINKLYPQDKAKGFHIGDVRGLWKVRFAP